jgi:outer membrane protein OmpA-like peptidoglycan-associated protein
VKKIKGFIHCPPEPFPDNLMRMRLFWLLLMALLLSTAPARAQVTVDLQALDKLPGAHPATKHQATQKSKPRRVATAKPQSQKAAEKPATEPPTATASLPPTVSPSSPQPPPATLPTAPPDTVALVPVPPPPAAAQPAPPPPPPISDSAASAATATGAGLRVTFGAGQTDLSPASAAAIKSIVQSTPTGDSTSFNVMAYAAGTPEDPSTARRLSLARALAVRSALMADGVTSSRIYVRALGATGGDEAPDRVDLAVMGGNAAAALPANANASCVCPFPNFVRWRCAFIRRILSRPRSALYARAVRQATPQFLIGES